SRSYFVRLDYAVWRQIKIYAVFVGIFTSLCFFILNITLLLIRRLVGWHLAKVERTGRVQNILEAMERCRQRQMDSLYEKYTTGIQQICENYRQQLEQLRKGYTQQSERFRDYRTAQIDAVTQHIDFIREGYAQQAGRVWEYGSKQMERLWDSYRRQVNRLRTFTISYRFRVMRQHKIKQKYWNKILASFNWDLYKLPSPKVIFIDPKTSQLPRISPEELANTKPVIKVPKISIISADAGDDDFDEHIDVDGATYSAIAEDPFSSRFNIRSSDGYRQPLQRDRNVEEHNGEGTMLLKHCSSHTSLITIDSDKKRLNDYECDENQKAFNESTFRSPDDGVELKSNEGHVAF
ncbi:unnamed protein product, partial [Soboliphyme baturini]|uniref:F-BAR domain-containing protein n=1 Tax=Soboliphyme baturini TaxID=241478 RepID=A0A183I951_9BILA